MLAQFKKYPIDTTGKSKDNLIVNERHEIDPLHRAIVTREGPFYGESMVIRKEGRILVHGSDYRHDDLVPESTKYTHKDIFTSIIILKEDLMGEIFLTYQAYGKEDDFTPDYIRQLVKEACRKDIVKWLGIVNRPDAFPPEKHKHPLYDIIYWNSVVEQLRNLVSVISNLRMSRDSWLYGEFGKFQTEVSRRLENFEAISTRASDLVGGIEKFKQDSQVALNNLEARINAMQSANELQIYLTKMKHDLEVELSTFKKQLEAKQTALTSSLNEQLAKLKIDVSTKVTQDTVTQLINGAIGNFVTNDVLTSRLSAYAPKNDIVTLTTKVETKIDNTVARNLIAEAAKTAQWATVSGKPKLLTHDEKNRITGDLNDLNSYILPGTYTIPHTARNIPVLKSFGYLTNQSGKGLLEVLGDKEGGILYQRYLVDGEVYHRTGRVQGEFVTFDNKWSKATLMTDNTQTDGYFNKTDSRFFQINNGDGNAPKIIPSLRLNGVSLPSPTNAGGMDGNGVMIGGVGQRTMLYSYGVGHHYIAVNDNAVGLANYDKEAGWEVEKLITSKTLYDEFPYLWTTNTDLLDLRSRLERAEGALDSSNIVSRALLQETDSDTAMGKIVRLFDGGRISVRQVRLVGNGNPTFQVNEDGHVHLNAKFRPAEINLTSDKRLKTDIRPIENPLEKLKDISGYTYRMLDAKDQTAGLLAQEVQEVLPCAVSEDKNGFLSLNYNAVIPLLLEAIKVQQVQITRLELRVNELLTKESEDGEQ